MRSRWKATSLCIRPSYLGCKSLVWPRTVVIPSWAKQGILMGMHMECWMRGEGREGMIYLTILRAQKSSIWNWKKMYIWALEIMRKMAIAMYLDLWIILHWLRILHILWEVGAEKKFLLRLTYFRCQFLVWLNMWLLAHEQNKGSWWEHTGNMTCGEKREVKSMWFW